jgi:hypothetical protein
MLPSYLGTFYPGLEIFMLGMQKRQGDQSYAVAVMLVLMESFEGSFGSSGR